ncbi:MAG TPA: tRNA (guanosine(46)-N7)-methyltransferase TrmB [Nevskia sp.]|nr:tRNA (guanosine(46)-N7)-methyltransferase TrmB [Nevskia sp.]
MSEAPRQEAAEGAQPRAIRSFVRREGRITPAQEQALERLWPRYGVEFDGAVLDPAALFGRTAPLVVEIGFGNGDHLLASAQKRPDSDFLGIEVHRPGAGRVLQQADKLGLANLRVLCADAVEVLRQGLRPGTVDEVVIFFPDPWPKKRHHKRRLVQPAFARVLARALRPGGRLRLATDWADYARHMQEVLNAEPQFANRAADGGAVPRPADRPLTRFESRGLRLGHAVADFEFLRK